MKIPIYPGQTSVILGVMAQNAASTFGGGLASLTGTTSGLTGYYWRTDGGASVSITLTSAGTLGVFNSGSLKLVDDTNLPGVLQFCPPNAALPPIGGQTYIVLQGATNLVPVAIELFDAGTVNAYQSVQNVNGGVGGSLNAATNAQVVAAINNQTSGTVTSSSNITASENALAVWNFLQANATVANSMGAFVLTLAPGSPVDVTISTVEARIK